jgi:hypothetical protein
VTVITVLSVSQSVFMHINEMFIGSCDSLLVNLMSSGGAIVVDERFQLDATIVIYYHKLSLHVSGIYMPIFRSTGCMLLHMVFSTRCCSCGPKEPV